MRRGVFGRRVEPPSSNITVSAVDDVGSAHGPLRAASVWGGITSGEWSRTLGVFGLEYTPWRRLGRLLLDALVSRFPGSDALADLRLYSEVHVDSRRLRASRGRRVQLERLRRARRLEPERAGDRRHHRVGNRLVRRGQKGQSILIQHC